MTRLIRRAVLAMVAASAGIVLHGQTTTAGQRARSTSDGLTAPGRRTDPTAHRRSSATSSACPRPSRCRRSRCRTPVPLPVIPTPASRCSRRSRCSRAIGRRQYHRAPIPTSASRSHRSSIPASANPSHPSRTHRSSIPASADRCRPVTDPGAGQPVPPIADPPSPDPDVGTPPAPDEAGRPPADEPGGSGDPAPSSGDPTAVDALPPPGPADGVTHHPRPVVATAGPGPPPRRASDGHRRFLARRRAAAVDAASDAPIGRDHGDPTVDLAADDTVASGGAVDAEVEGPTAETWVPSGGGGRASLRRAGRRAGGARRLVDRDRRRQTCDQQAWSMGRRAR